MDPTGSGITLDQIYYAIVALGWIAAFGHGYSAGSTT